MLNVWRKLNLGMLVVALLLPLSFANAQDEAQPASSNAGPNSAAANKERKQTLSFEDELVDGATQKPELFYLFQKKNFNYKRLIKLRENFIPEMKRTSEEIQRVRSTN